MPFQLEQVSPNVSQIELKTFFNQVFETDSKLTTEYFSLGRLNPLVSYTGGCSLYIKPIIKQDVRTYSVKLSLRWYRRPVIHHDEQQSSPEIHHLPRAISVSVNGGETRKLKLDACRSFDRGFWEADEFVVSSKDLPNGIGQLQPFPLTLKFLVEFESSFSLSEKNALKEFTDLFVKQIDCDVQFCFPASNKLIGGHVNILSARSPVLKQAIIASKIIRIEDQMDIFQHFLLFIYSGQILVPLTEERAQSLYKLAEKYCVNDLKESCVDFLISCFRKDNIWQLIAFADTHSIDKLKKAANAFKELSVREIQMAALKGNATSVAQPMNQTVPGGVSGQTDVKLHAAPSLARPSTSGCKPPKKCSCVMCENLAPSALNVAKPTIPPATPLKPAMPQIASPTKTSTGNDLPKASVLPASVVVKSETVLHPKEPDVERKEPEVLKTETAPATKKPTATNNPLHPPYLEMITTAIGKLKERSGSSRQALLKYILSNYTLGVDAKMANVHLKQALKRGVNSGVLWNTKGSVGAAGSFRISTAADKAKKSLATAKKIMSVPSAPKKKTVAAKMKAGVKASSKKTTAATLKKASSQKKSAAIKNKKLKAKASVDKVKSKVNKDTHPKAALVTPKAEAITIKKETIPKTEKEKPIRIKEEYPALMAMPGRVMVKLEGCH